jgi:hypothetical protein
MPYLTDRALAHAISGIELLHIQPMGRTQRFTGAGEAAHLRVMAAAFPLTRSTPTLLLSKEGRDCTSLPFEEYYSQLAAVEHIQP